MVPAGELALERGERVGRVVLVSWRREVEEAALARRERRDQPPELRPAAGECVATLALPRVVGSAKAVLDDVALAAAPQELVAPVQC